MSNIRYWKASIYTRGGHALPSNKDLVGKLQGIETDVYDIQGEIGKVCSVLLFVYVTDTLTTSINLYIVFSGLWYRWRGKPTRKVPMSSYF